MSIGDCCCKSFRRRRHPSPGGGWADMPVHIPTTETSVSPPPPAPCSTPVALVPTSRVPPVYAHRVRPVYPSSLPAVAEDAVLTAQTDSEFSPALLDSLLSLAASALRSVDRKQKETPTVSPCGRPRSQSHRSSPRPCRPVAGLVAPGHLPAAAMIRLPTPAPTSVAGNGQAHHRSTRRRSSAPAAVP